MEPMTFVCTSCGRYDLLEATMESFRKHNTRPVARWIIIEDSERPSVKERIEARFGDFCEVILNPRRLGMFGSTDRAYEEVETELVFHCEDDWEFLRPGFVEESLAIMEDPGTLQVYLRSRDSLSAELPWTDVKTTGSGVRYRELTPSDFWGGYSTNPGVKRMSDYRKLGPGGYAQFVKERVVGQKFRELGYRVAILEEPAIRHIGDGRHVRDYNKDPLLVRGTKRLFRRLFLR